MVQTHGIKPKLVVIAGPTASGKSEMAVRIAADFDGEVVGCDSMQIYRGMDIGTGKITQAEKRDIPHYMIDIVSPKEEFSVSEYKRRAELCIADIVQRGKLPVLAGGTGLYINALLSGLNFAETPRSEKVRETLRKEAESEGSLSLYKRLQQVDPVSAGKIFPNDLKRIIRALEIYIVTGKPKSEQASKGVCPYDALLLVLTPDRARLYARINDRVEAMFAGGLVEEVRRLYPFKDTQAMQAIGYKETVAYLEGRCDLGTAIETVKQNSRRYAKRQLTYFRHMDGAVCLPPDYEAVFNAVNTFINL